MSQLPPMPSIPSGFLPTGLPPIPDVIDQVLAGSSLPGIPSLPPMPSGLDEFLNNLLAGSPLPPALPSNQNGPYMALLNGSALPHGLLPTEYEEMFNNIIHGSPVPEEFQEGQDLILGVLAGSALPTRRMPSIPVIPGMPSIDIGPYQDILGQLFDSVKGMFGGVDIAPADLLKELTAQGFAVPSIDPTRLLANRDEYLAKLREQFQKLAEKLREKNLLAEISNMREELTDVLGGRKQFNMSSADDYLDRLGGLVGNSGFDGLNSTLQGALKNISMGEVHDSMRRIGALVSQSQEKFEKMTGDFKFAAQKLIDGAKNLLNFNTTAVGLPPLPLLNQTLTLIEWASNPYEGLTGRKLNSSVVSVMLADALSGNETVVRGLEQLINITLAIVGGGSGSGSSIPECVYWNTSVGDWLGDGCLVQEVRDGSVVCGCNHLTDFGVILVSPVGTIPASPGPRPGGVIVMAATGTSAAGEKDMKPLIGGVVGGVAGTLVLSIVAANLWDRRKKARRAKRAIGSQPMPPTVVNPVAMATMV